MHRFLYFFALSAWLLMLEFSVFSVQRLAHTFPTSEIFIKTEVLSIFSIINLSSSTNSPRSLNTFWSLHNNFGFSARSSSSFFSNLTFSDNSEFPTICTISIAYQHFLLSSRTLSSFLSSIFSDNSEFPTICTYLIAYQQSQIMLRPSALYRQPKKTPQLEPMANSDSSSQQKSKKIKSIDNDKGKSEKLDVNAIQDMDISREGQHIPVHLIMHQECQTWTDNFHSWDIAYPL